MSREQKGSGNLPPPLSLPEWMKEGCGCTCHVEGYGCDNCCHWDKHMNALAIAWIALSEIKRHEKYGAPCCDCCEIVAKKAMSKITKMGK